MQYSFSGGEYKYPYYCRNVSVIVSPMRVNDMILIIHIEIYFTVYEIQAKHTNYIRFANKASVRCPLVNYHFI